ncbi:prolipoprotein diacylglyceryl transferase [Thermopetrobacter sp. TC1]|uniref:prolipoprotein diacylglyceryl transferase n=1 Tax=Thermopetrobacter sp. TC1 TaxID=1495045 RepID=UPI00056E2839|nr:prolipoprotein diacylglyceryl transferase [Thermopetrobacter sp. TC1]
MRGMMPTVFAIPFPAIDPVAISLGPLQIRWYALAYIVGLILAVIWAKHLLKQEALWRPGRPFMSPSQLDDFMVWAMLGVVIGGRTGYVLFYNPGYYLSHPGNILAVWQGGMSFHGGFAGLIAAAWLFCRRHGLSLLRLLDLSAASVPLALFLGRLANFINGELWGRPTDVPWAMIFPRAGPEPRHPSQLYEAGLEGIVLFLVLWWLIVRYRALARPGLVAGVFTSGYALSRIFVEFFREPDRQIGYLAGDWLTMGMVLSLPLLAVGGWLILRALRNPPAGDA